MNTNIHNNDEHNYKISSNGDAENLKKTYFNLFGLIVMDLLRHQKISLFLMLLIILSANGILETTQQIRGQLLEREELLLEHGVLESEWRNLVIEENVLADPKRVENKAKTQLGMIYVTPKNETVIVIKSKE